MVFMLCYEHTIVDTERIKAILLHFIWLFFCVVLCFRFSGTGSPLARGMFQPTMSPKQALNPYFPAPASQMLSLQIPGTCSALFSVRKLHL